MYQNYVDMFNQKEKFCYYLPPPPVLMESLTDLQKKLHIKTHALERTA